MSKRKVKPKSGPIPKSVKDEILTKLKNKEEIDVESYARAAKKSVDTINNFIENNRPKEPEKIEIKPESQPDSIAMNLMGRRKDRGVVAMTEAASSYSDETKRKPRDLPARYKNCIHKIKPDEKSI